MKTSDTKILETQSMNSYSKMLRVHRSWMEVKTVENI